MAWLALSFLVLLSANAVLSTTPYDDPMISAHSYLNDCIKSEGDLANNNAVKKIFSGPDCYAQTEIQFKVDPQHDHFFTSYEQGSVPAAPAKIKYKFGGCFDIVIEIKKDAAGNAAYTLHKPDGTKADLPDGFVFYVKRNAGQGPKPDVMDVYANGVSFHTDTCNAFDGSPELMKFKQEVLSGVPDLTLVWKVSDPTTPFGTAYAENILEVGTTDAPTTTTLPPAAAQPTTTPADQTSTTLPVKTSDAPTADGKPNWLIPVIIVASVTVGLLVLVLIIGCLIMRSLGRKDSDAETKD